MSGYIHSQYNEKYFVLLKINKIVMLIIVGKKKICDNLNYKYPFFFIIFINLASLTNLAYIYDLLNNFQLLS